MPDFDKFVARHGEAGAQWLIENIERREGVSCVEFLPLEERWRALNRKPLVAANGNERTRGLS
jgi:hypothetical protein